MRIILFQIMSMLMVRKPQEMTALMNKNSEKLLKGFVSHADAFSIAELLKRLLQPYHSGNVCLQHCLADMCFCCCRS